jgi:LPXTG-motif cell wall-anchored protein
MQKSKLLPGLAVGVLTLGVAGLSTTASAAGPSWHSASSHSALRGGDDGDESGDDTASGGGGGGGGGGSLPSTGSDPTSMVMLGAIALTAGGVVYRVSSRRAHSA